MTQTEYTLADAARMTRQRVHVLRTYIARGILKHVGQIPLAGQERKFSIDGLVEVAIINALSGCIPLLKAAMVADCVVLMDWDRLRARTQGNEPVLCVFRVSTNSVACRLAYGWREVKAACSEVSVIGIPVHMLNLAEISDMIQDYTKQTKTKAA